MVPFNGAVSLGVTRNGAVSLRVTFNGAFSLRAVLAERYAANSAVTTRKSRAAAENQAHIAVCSSRSALSLTIFLSQAHTCLVDGAM